MINQVMLFIKDQTNNLLLLVIAILFSTCFEPGEKYLHYAIEIRLIVIALLFILSKTIYSLIMGISKKD